MAKIYIVRLTQQERAELMALVKTGRGAAYKRLNAQILLKSDVSEGSPRWIDVKIAECFDVSVRKVERLRERLCTRGLEKALVRAKGGGRKRKLDGVQEAQLITLVCSDTPEGHANWTLRLLANKMVELKYIDNISHEAVRQVLKKRDKTLAKERVVHSAKRKR